ncbi:hypothetical protein EV1_003244 [Malus domestica]
MSWKTLKHPGSRRIKKALFVLRSTIIHQFKIKPRRPLKKVFFVLRSSFIQDQAPTALWINNHPPIQDQAPTTLEESVLRSSFFVLRSSLFQDQAPTALEESIFVHRLSKIKPQRPFGSTIIHQFKIKPRRPLKKKAPSFIIRSSKIKPQRPFGSTTSSPKALEVPFITVIQDQALTALEETLILKIKPQRLLEDPLKSTFKDQAHGLLKKLPTEFSVFTNWHAQWDISTSHLFLRLRNPSTPQSQWHQARDKPFLQPLREGS